MSSKNTNHASFGEYVKMYRKELGYTQIELADKVGYSPDTLRKIEQNKRHPSAIVVKKLIEVLYIPEEQQGLFYELSQRKLPDIQLQINLHGDSPVVLPTPIELSSPQNNKLPLDETKDIRLFNRFVSLFENHLFTSLINIIKKHKSQVYWIGIVLVIFIFFVGVFFFDQEKFLAGYLFRLTNGNKFQKQVTVVANKGWQNTSIYLIKGDKITIEYLSGLWTANKDDLVNVYYVDANGYDADSWKNASWLSFPQANYGSLIGSIDQTYKFSIGKKQALIVQNSGFLLLRMNDSDCEDHCLRDNDGIITISIFVNTPN